MGESKILRLMAALCLCTALVACGDSDADADGDPDAGGGTGGTGGAGGTGGSTGGTGGGGTITECGGTMCPDLSAAMGMVQTCCTASDQCSVQLPTATDCPEPPELDECGTFDIAGISIPLCCMDDGKCGINAEQFMPGVGCVSAETVMMAGFPIMIPDKSCGGDGGVETDAGN